MKILDHFRLNNEKEDYNVVIDIIDRGTVFKGTNLWILVFAIFIASLGLNVNSTAVIIGAMLVSPLMGPIMGMGLGMAINDLVLLKKALFNYLFAAAVGLTTSTLYFLLSPIDDAHSEILARTSPNIYDVLIALFGGLAGILATSSKQKGNVIPGVAIATALMPPLCTAGYGLATWNAHFFFGAFYLFLINTVFIALATLLTARFLKFPFKTLPDEKADKKNKQIISAIVVITVIPSIYFGYDIVQTNKFQQQVNKFIENEAVFPNDYLLSKDINKKKKQITLTYGGEYIDKQEIELLKKKLPHYELDNVTLEIRQGFSYLKETKKEDLQSTQIGLALKEKANAVTKLNKQMDSINAFQTLSKQIYRELKSQIPAIDSYILQPTITNSESTEKHVWISVIKTKRKLPSTERERIKNWLKVRLNTKDEIIYLEEQ
jgi:uncharacterized hydrophobic protein (TIGR00271 family)